MTPAHRSSVDEHDSTPGEEEGEVCVKWEGKECMVEWEGEECMVEWERGRGVWWNDSEVLYCFLEAGL